MWAAIQSAVSSIFSYVWSFVPGVATLQLFFIDWLKWFLAQIEGILGHDIILHADSAATVLRFVGKFSALLIQIVMPMPIFTKFLAAGIVLGLMAVSIRSVVVVKNHFWSAGA